MLDRLLVMDPDRRASAAELLEHPYFANYADPEDEVGGAYCTVYDIIDHVIGLGIMLFFFIFIYSLFLDRMMTRLKR